MVAEVEAQIEKALASMADAALKPPPSGLSISL
jgi:hypothetical protein